MLLKRGLGGWGRFVGDIAARGWGWVMGLLYLSELQDSREWVNQNAEDILKSVQKIDGGWGTIFPKGVPMWLHKVRNYFNVEPKTLRLVDRSVTAHWMQEARSH